jgi:GR25 family glycosyltransferase involved in LPS biosynthesis
MTKDNIAFTIFHIPGNDRDDLYAKSHNTMLQSFPELDTPTVVLKDNLEVGEFFNNREISINKNGFYNSGWKIGELGIWGSTYLAWKNFVKSKYDYLIIMEDDIILDDDFIDKFNFYKKELPEDWEVFFVHSPEFLKFIEFNKYRLDCGKGYLARSHQIASALCYVITKPAAEKLIELVKEPVISPIDQYIMQDVDLKRYSLRWDVKNICTYPTNLKSQIQESPKIIFGSLPNI